MNSLNDKINNSIIIFESIHPITLDFIQIKEFDGFHFWMENKIGEGMAIRKDKLIKFFNLTHDEFNKIFKDNF